MDDVSFVSIKGSLSTKVVKNCDSVLNDVFNPQIVLEIGSSPIATFCVNGRSVRFITVAPTLKLSDIW